jgi:hypothetical protein
VKLSVHITRVRQGKSLPREIVTIAWGFEDLTVPDALRRVADVLDAHAVEDIVVWVERTDREVTDAG